MNSILCALVVSLAARADLMDLVREANTAPPNQVVRIRHQLTKAAPSGAKFALGVLREVAAVDEPWKQTDRRLYLLDLLLEKNADLTKWPEFASPSVRDKMRRLIRGPLATAAATRQQKTWPVLTTLTDFVTHFDLWDAEHLPFLADEVYANTVRAPELLAVLAEVYPRASDAVRTKLLRREDYAGAPPFWATALAWLYGPRPPAEDVVAAWLRWSVNGRSMNAAEGVRAVTRHLGQLVREDLERRAREGDNDVRTALSHSASGAGRAAALDANQRDHLARL